MHCCEVYRKSSEIYLDSTFPERVIARRCQGKAKLYPKTAMAIEVLAAVILGTLKIITFPLATFSSIGLLPIACALKGISSRSCSHFLAYLGAWFISLLVSALIIAAIFGLVMIAPEAVFFMIGVCGALGASATLLHIHRELFSLRSLQTQEIKEVSDETRSSPSPSPSARLP
ncbi:DUF5422 family protein [Chlamydia caviae]|uniref:Uncharacterized protein n=1 Tax=Chlamydia caviae (strain ATCC VR-813 / DSM 19441 / 03DC25 / GPIC) TaxID=227941 RepID=Q823W4_CHLCV|nr:DUF5422 family protein [Chlamydia caviae]AAP05040.1 conserved hypothetical protein [Chlamydia caviae GPIC]